MQELIYGNKELEPIFNKCLSKVTHALSKWQGFIDRRSDNSNDWFRETLRDYRVTSPTIPLLRPKSSGDISVLMTLDPSLSFSLFKPTSDGLITLNERRNLTVDRARFAPIFAMIGAARFLRAQHTPNGFVNLYVPAIKRIVVQADTRMDLLKRTMLPAKQAAVYSWLNYFSKSEQLGATWQGLFYQTLQTTKKNAILLGNGYFDTEWLVNLVDKISNSTINYWRKLLSTDRRQVPFELGELVDSLSEHNLSAWLRHLKTISVYSSIRSGEDVRPYTILEMKELMQAMDDPNNRSLTALFEPGTGTMRYGRALRQLGKVNLSALRDMINKLDAVQTVPQLTRTLGIVAQECEVASAKSKFVIIPRDGDLNRALSEAEIYGVRAVADLMIALSTHRYSAKKRG